MSETVLKGGISYTEGEIEYTWHTEEGACEKCQALNGLTFKNASVLSGDTTNVLSQGTANTSNFCFSFLFI